MNEITEEVYQKFWSLLAYLEFVDNLIEGGQRQEVQCLDSILELMAHHWTHFEDHFSLSFDVEANEQLCIRSTIQAKKISI